MVALAKLLVLATHNLMPSIFIHQFPYTLTMNSILALSRSSCCASATTRCTGMLQVKRGHVMQVAACHTLPISCVAPSRTALQNRRFLLHHQQLPQQRQLSSRIDILVDPRAMSRQKRRSDQDNRGKKKKKDKSSRPSYRFVDRARIRVSGGQGGKGSLSMQSISRRHRLRPDGGHGGNGGCVIIVADPHEQTLQWSQRPHIQAESGTNGGSQEKFGRNGKNYMVRVPCGVVVKRVLDHNEVWDEEEWAARKVLNSEEMSVGLDDNNLDSHELDAHDEPANDTTILSSSELDDNSDVILTEEQGDYFFSDYHENETVKERQTVVLADLDEPGSHIVVARGGRGGMGTCVYASENGTLPDVNILVHQAKPEPGEVVFLELELKMIADIGLVGFPNAGKSSLLRAMSRATPEVAPYPFTTLHPIIGCVDYQDGFQVKIADIPGLVEGASEGRGRGHDFLRHVERTKALLYIVDVAGADYRDPIEDLKVLVNELESYGDGSLLERRALVVANKVDLLREERIPEKLGAIQDVANELGILTEQAILGISAGVTGSGLETLSKSMRNIVSTSEKGFRLEFESSDQLLFT